MNYRLVITPRAERQIRQLERPIRARVMEAVQELTVNPRMRGTIKLQGREAYRLRVGDYRIIYGIDDAARTVSIRQVGHRSDVYRG